jgi:hypothetical protein
MKDSDTYWAIFEEGQEKEAKSLILRMGPKRLGPPDESIIAKLSGITDLARLDRLIDRLFDGTAASWQDLLDTP